MKELFEYCKEFGIGVLLQNGITRIFSKFRIPNEFTDKYIYWKHRRIEDYLYRHYYSCLSDTFSEIVPEPSSSNNVYVFWWQGEENAPELVKYCLESIRKNSRRNVILLSQYNYEDYVTLPDYIVRKANEGKMCLAHFSDVIRFYLLYKYGGVWIDATCLLTDEIPEIVFTYPFYSLKGPYYTSRGLMWDWTSFYMAAHPGNIICQKMLAFYYNYWKEHDCAITYLILDCWLNVIKAHNEEAGNIIDAIPEVDASVFSLLEILNDNVNPIALRKLFNSTYIHKLTYKKLLCTEKSGAITNWGHILQNENTNACELEG